MTAQPRLLVVSPTFPFPLVSGGKQRVFYVLRELAREFDVTLLSLAEPSDLSGAAREALGFLAATHTAPIRQHRIAQLLRLGLQAPRWLTGTPAEVLVKRSTALEREYRELLATGAFDAVLVEYSQFLDLVPIARRHGLPVAVTAHDVSFVSQQRKAEVSSGFWRWFWTREARLMRRHEVRGWNRSGVVFAMSDHDAAQIREVVPDATVHTMPNGVDTTLLQPMAEADAQTVVFVGWMRHFPNRDAVRWLLGEVWPEVRRRAPSARLRICGGGMPDDMIELSRREPGVEYLGYVEHIDQAVGRATLSIVPIRVGSGSRLKILESMALGTPVVSTRVGCEGILVTPGTDIAVGDDPRALADVTVLLLADAQQRARMAGAARTLVESSYDWRAIGTAGSGVLRELIATNANRDRQA